VKRNIFAKGGGQEDFDNRQVICPSGRLDDFQTHNDARGMNGDIVWRRSAA
jgi:hypothetical protein